jgi:hypothetical protein
MYAYKIVETYLRENGYAGLKNCDNGCSCLLGRDYADCDYFGAYCEGMYDDGTVDDDDEE